MCSSLKIKFFILFLVNFLIIVFVIFLRPELILETKFELVELVTPKMTIGNNQRIISFNNNGKDFDALCVDSIDKLSNPNISICEYKYEIKSIQMVSGCRPLTILSKNRKTSRFFIDKVNYVALDGKTRVFKINSICDSSKVKRDYFYFLFLLVNLIIVFYLFQQVLFNSSKE